MWNLFGCHTQLIFRENALTSFETTVIWHWVLALFSSTDLVIKFFNFSHYTWRCRTVNWCVGALANTGLLIRHLVLFEPLPSLLPPPPPPPSPPLVRLQIKWLIRGSKEGGSLRVQERFIAGSLAGATAQTIIYPMEVSVNVSSCSSRNNTVKMLWQ